MSATMRSMSFGSDRLVNMNWRTNPSVAPLKSARIEARKLSSSSGLIRSSTLLSVSTGTRAATRSAESFAASRITGPPIEWPTRTALAEIEGLEDGAYVGAERRHGPFLPRSAGFAVPREVDGYDAIGLGEVLHLWPPIRAVAGPAVNEHDRRRSAPVGLVTDIDPVGRLHRPERRGYGENAEKNGAEIHGPSSNGTQLPEFRRAPCTARREP